MKKNIVFIVFMLCIIFSLIGCGRKEAKKEANIDIKSDLEDLVVDGKKVSINSQNGIDKSYSFVNVGYSVNTLNRKTNNSGYTDISWIAYIFNSTNVNVGNINESSTEDDFINEGWLNINKDVYVKIITEEGVESYDEVASYVDKFAEKYPDYLNIDMNFSSVAPYEDPLLCDYIDGNDYEPFVPSPEFTNELKYSFKKHLLNEKLRKGELKSYCEYRIINAGGFNLSAKIFGNNETIARLCEKDISSSRKAEDYLKPDFDFYEETVYEKERLEEFKDFKISDNVDYSLSCSAIASDKKSIIFSFKNNSKYELFVDFFNPTINDSYAANKYGNIKCIAAAGETCELTAECPEDISEIESISFYYTVWCWDENTELKEVKCVEKIRLTEENYEKPAKPECELIAKNDEIAVSKLLEQNSKRCFSYYIENLTDKTIFLKVIDKHMYLNSDEGNFSEEEIQDKYIDEFSLVNGLYALNPGCGTAIQVGFDEFATIVDKDTGEVLRPSGLSLESLSFTIAVEYFDKLMNITEYEKIGILDDYYQYVSGIYVNK